MYMLTSYVFKPDDHCHRSVTIHSSEIHGHRLFWRHMSRPISGIFVLLACAAGLSAQVDHASLTGTVMDASYSAVPGARVEAVSTATGVRRQRSEERRVGKE